MGFIFLVKLKNPKIQEVLILDLIKKQIPKLKQDPPVSQMQ